MCFFLIRSFVVSTCILLLVASPIPRDSNDPDNQSFANSEVTDKLLIDGPVEASDWLEPPGANAFQARRSLNPAYFIKRDFHESDLSRRAGLGVNLRDGKAQSRDEFPPVRPAGNSPKYTQLSGLNGETAKKPSGALRSDAPEELCPPSPEKTASQDKTYNDPMNASVEDLEDLIRFWLDPKHDHAKACRRLRARQTYKVKNQTVHHTVRSRPQTDIPAYHTNIPTETDATKRHQGLLFLVVTHPEYDKRARKSDVLKYLQQTYLNGATSNELAADYAQYSVVPEELYSAAPKKTPSQDEAFRNPIDASIGALEDLIKWLDKSQEASIVSRRVRQRETRREKEQPKHPWTLKDIKPYHTELPEETDTGKRHRALLVLVTMHPAYHFTTMKSRVFQFLQQPEPNAITSIIKASQRYPDSFSTHPLDSSQSLPVGSTSMSTSGGSPSDEFPSLSHNAAHNLASYGAAGVTVRPSENFGTGTSTLPSAAPNLNGHLPHDVFSSMAMNHPIGVRLPQDFRPGTSTLGGSGLPHYDTSSSHSLTAAQFQPVRSSSWASPSTEPPSLLHHSAQDLAVHPAYVIMCLAQGQSAIPLGCHLQRILALTSQDCRILQRLGIQAFMPIMQQV
ncbi:hypothetical protein H0H93_012422 [Arthromyces matolae]|nr:hypothetical protein H0H93_012422 [Arthromyces matolae]